MKVTFEETTSRKEWLHKELLNSLTPEVIDKAMEDRFYDVKLLVNGIELEPSFYNSLVSGIEKYVEKEAAELLKAKFELVKEKTQKLSDIVDSCIDTLMEEIPRNYED